MKPRVNVVQTKAASTGGVPVYYDDGYYYGDDYLYYGTWYAADGDLTQGEKPVASVEKENIGVVAGLKKPTISIIEENVRINIDVDKPIIKVLE